MRGPSGKNRSTSGSRWQKPMQPVRVIVAPSPSFLLASSAAASTSRAPAAIPQLAEDFRVPPETLAGTARGNQKRFTQTIRAKRADVKEIPAIEFAYFDPQAGQYAVARSEPIPVLVSVVERDEKAAGVLNRLWGDAAQDPIFLDALHGRGLIFHRIATAAVQQAVKVAGRTFREIAPLE